MIKKITSGTSRLNKHIYKSVKEVYSILLNKKNRETKRYTIKEEIQ